VSGSPSRVQGRGCTGSAVGGKGSMKEDVVERENVPALDNAMMSQIL